MAARHKSAGKTRISAMSANTKTAMLNFPKCATVGRSARSVPTMPSDRTTEVMTSAGSTSATAGPMASGSARMPRGDLRRKRLSTWMESSIARPKGWRGFHQEKPSIWADSSTAGARLSSRPKAETAKPPKKAGLSFTERHRLEELPALIARLEGEIGKLTALLSDAGLFTREPAKFAKATEALAQRQAALEAAEEEWLRLEEKAEKSA